MEITLPHKYKARWYQRSVWAALNTFRRVYYICHRRGGKDITVWNYVIGECVKEPIIAWYILPTKEQARKVIWDAITNDGTKFFDFIPPEIIEKIDNTTKVIYFKNGSTLWLLGADADSLVGANPKLIVMSEYAVYDKDPWPLLQPILQMNGGQLIIVTTPRGTNHAYDLFIKAKQSKHWAVIEHSIEYTKVLNEQQLLEVRAETTADMYDQEYLLKWIDGASQVFRGTREACIYREVDDTGTQSDPKLWEGNMSVDPNKKYRMAVDLAKMNDETVITVIDLHTFRVAKQIAFNNLDYPFQEARILQEFYKWNKPEVVIDDTGVGKAFCDSIEPKLHGKLVRFVFTFNSRMQILQNLALKIEQRSIVIPNDEKLHTQLASFVWATTPSGKMTIASPDHLLNDYVMSLAMCLHELPANPKPYRNQSVENDVKQFDANKNKQHNNGIRRYR